MLKLSNVDADTTEQIMQSYTSRAPCRRRICWHSSIDDANQQIVLQCSLLLTINLATSGPDRVALWAWHYHLDLQEGLENTQKKSLNHLNIAVMWCRQKYFRDTLRVAVRCHLSVDKRKRHKKLKIFLIITGAKNYTFLLFYSCSRTTWFCFIC